MIRSVVAAFLFLALFVSGASAQSCSVPNNLTNGTNADASQVMANFAALLACVNAGSGGGLRTRTVFTSGSGTYTTPTGCKAINVRMVGGGAGGQGNSTGGTSTGTTAGGATTFGSLTANGGTVSVTFNYAPVSGGTASGGDINIRGAAGGGGGQLGSAAGQITGGTGAANVLGDGGQGLIGTGGLAANVPGSGGGGAGASTTAGQVAGSGGSAGGYSEKLIVSPSATYSYAVGSGGSGGTGISQNGGAGAAGIIIVDEFY